MASGSFSRLIRLHGRCRMPIGCSSAFATIVGLMSEGVVELAIARGWDRWLGLGTGLMTSLALIGLRSTLFTEEISPRASFLTRSRVG